MENSKRRGRKPLTPWVNPTERYNNDPEYKEHRKDLIRAHARKVRGVKTSPFDASKNLSKINQFASMKHVVSGVSCESILCLNAEELGQALGGYNKKTIHNWLRSGLLPSPVLEVLSHEGKNEGAYTVEEAEAIAPVIVEMQSKLLQLKDPSGIYKNKIRKAIQGAWK